MEKFGKHGNVKTKNLYEKNAKEVLEVYNSRLCPR
jgi:hypothetical protein